jgi:hypothetical protein
MSTRKLGSLLDLNIAYHGGNGSIVLLASKHSQNPHVIDMTLITSFIVLIDSTITEKSGTDEDMLIQYLNGKYQF